LCTIELFGRRPGGGGRRNGYLRGKLKTAEGSIALRDIDTGQKITALCAEGETDPGNAAAISTGIGTKPDSIQHGA
jgi:hypothetical protein